MKFFVNYALDEQSKVQELWQALRVQPKNDVWFDRRSIPASLWWDTILTQIEISHCVVDLWTPAALDSIYCHAITEYARALNKPMLPMIWESSGLLLNLPDEQLSRAKAIPAEATMDAVAALIEETVTGWPPPPPVSRNVPRPPEPLPARKADELLETFALAEEAAAQDNFSLAEKFFSQIGAIDPRGWGLAASERLNQLQFEHDRVRGYVHLAQMLKNPLLEKGALAIAKVYIQKYGSEYDPRAILAPLAATAQAHAAVQVVNNSNAALITRVGRPEAVERHAPPVIRIEEPAPGTRITDSTGVAMVYVPSGGFNMGSDTGRRNEQPRHQATISQGFWLDLLPVTNERFAQFIAENGYQTADYWTTAGWEWMQANTRSVPRNYNGFVDPQQPRVGVSWYEAYAYCRWRGGRLPTEVEWEWAARGPEERLYPWGNDFDARRVICNENATEGTAIVGDGIRAAGASWVGALDLSGNVWEWVNSRYWPYPYHTNSRRESSADPAVSFDNWRVRRGGSWFNFGFDLRTTFRHRGAPSSVSGSVGFRCACSA